MKKIFLSFTFLIGLILAVNAQEKPIPFGFKAGIAFPNMNYHILDNSLGGKVKTSFYIGAIADIKLSSLLSIQPGLTYINKGTKYDINYTDENGFSTTTKEGGFNFSYIEIPVNVLANFNLASGKLFVGTGPYVAYALSANEKLADFEGDIKFGSEDALFNRMDFGLNFLAGYQLTNGVNIHAGYGLGLKDFAKSSNLTAKNKVFSVGLGFNF